MAHPKISQKFVHFQDLILFEDDHILVVDKPLYMASLDDKSNRNLNHLAKLYNPDLQLCHRLDKNTSGVLLMAKSPENYREISLQFQRRQIKKVYKTLVHGVHRFENQEVDLPLVVSTNKKVFVNRDNGKKSVTIFNTEEIFRNYTLVNCQPITGRMHQIRAHLAAIRCPIIGDSLYGGKDIFLSELKRNYNPSGRKEELPVNHGYLLHAESLTLRHPVTEEEMQFLAPYPKNFSVCLKILENYNG